MRNEMQYRKIGNSELEASVVGLGTFAIGGWFWGGTDRKQSIEAIQTSIDSGISLIDTAPIYGYGLSEKIVGEAIRGRRDAVVLATKCGMVWDREAGVFHTHSDDKGPTGEPSKYKVYQYLNPDSVIEEVERSLTRLGTDYIDLYQTHWQDSTTPIADTMGALVKLKEQGKIRAIGVCNITLDQLSEYSEYGEIVSAQEKFNLMDRGIVEREIVDYCVDNRLGILSYFTLEQGLLTGKMSPDRVFEEGDMRGGNPTFSRENRQRVNDSLSKLAPFAEKYDASIAQVVIALTAAQRGISHLLIGSRNPTQAAENAKAGALRLSQADIDAMDAIVGELKL